MTIIQTSILIDKDYMVSIGYLVYLLLHLLFDRITATLNTVSLGIKQATRSRTIEKGTFYPNSKQGGRAPVPEPR